MSPERRTFFLLCGLAVAARLTLTVTTLGSNDAYFNSLWARLAQTHGVAGAYGQTAMMNHPPLSVGLMLVYSWLSSALNLPYVHVYRFFQIASDMLSAFALYRIGGGDTTRGRALALFVLLSPAAAFVSAFHGNSDPMMMALVVSAAALLILGRTAGAGMALGLASGIKILPFLLAPLFLLYTKREERSRFVAAFAATTAIIFLPTIVAGGPVVVRHIFGYGGGLAYEWGLPGVAFAASRLLPGLKDAGEWVMNTYTGAGRYIVYAAIAAVTILTLKRRGVDQRGVLTASAIMFLAILAVAPGFGVQYIAWLIPLLPFALSWRAAIATNAAASLFLFITYTVWSGGWPWWFADLARPGPHRWMAAVAGYTMWVVVCAALVSAVRRYAAEHRERTRLQKPTAELRPARDSD